MVGLGLATTVQTKASLRFNGSNSKAVLDGSYLDASTHSSYTYEVWIKPFSLGGTLIGKMEYWKAWTLDTTSDGGMLLTGSWPNYYWGTKVASGSLTTNVWQHVCCAVTGGQASFYVNGVLVGTETVQNPISFNASTNIGMMPPYGCDGVMSIGYTDSGTTPDYNFFNGIISGIKVWSRTLSASEVGAIFTLGVPPSTNGLYNAVMLDEVSGSAIEDSRTALTGRNLSALQSSDNPPMSQADLSFTNSTPIASYFIDLSHYNDFKTPVLSSQSNYCFKATGRGGVGPLDRGDAMADAAFYPSFHPLTAKWAAPDNTWTWVGHTPFRPTPDVLNPAHVYYFYFQGSNKSEELTFQDNPYSDNVGGFNVDLYVVSPQSFLSNGLVAYYPFSGNANDASGNGNNGTPLNTQFTVDRFGVANAALAFNGIQTTKGSMVIITNPLFNLGQQEYTVNFWFNVSNITQQTRCFFSGANTATGITIDFNDNNAPGYIVYDIGPGNAFWTSLYHHGPKNDFQPGQWYALSFTKRGVLYSIYVDGQLQDEQNVSAASGYNFNFEPLIGAYDLLGDQVLDGDMDDVRIYNRALSPDEVAQLYAYESTPPSPPCSPHKATATAQLDNTFVVGAAITDHGCGYSNAPVVLIQGGGGSGATAIAVVSNGVVVKIIITDAGFGYTSAPSIAIASPPFVPTVSIAVSAVKVTQHVVLGRNYVLEASTDLVTWTATEPQFTAQAETIVNEFDVDVTGRYFRIRQVP